MERTLKSTASLSATDRLLNSDPFCFSDENRELFLESFRETAQAHYEGNLFFRALWEQEKLQPQDIKTEKDLSRVPPIMVHLFKERELKSVPDSQIALTLTSSGTGGQKSQMFLNSVSLERVKKLAYRIHAELGLTSNEEVNYVCFAYDPAIAKDLGTAFTDDLLTSFTKKKSVYYTFQWDDSKKQFFFNEAGTLVRLRELEKEGSPVRLLGFPAFLHQVLEKNNLHLKLHPQSWVQTGGGWKSASDREISKPIFRNWVAERLGIATTQVRDLFGMVEHGIPYIDCELGNMHIPQYARVWTRSPDGRKILETGERGLLQLSCTYNNSYPAMSLLTTDWGRVATCTCSREGFILELQGRAGLLKQKGCAITAAELLQAAS